MAGVPHYLIIILYIYEAMLPIFQVCFLLYSLNAAKVSY